jgi:hypothetical protein
MGGQASRAGGLALETRIWIVEVAKTWYTDVSIVGAVGTWAS